MFKSVRQFLGRIKAGSPVIGALVNVVSPGEALWHSLDYGSYAAEGYGANPYVFAAIDYIAKSVAGVPWKITRVGGKQDVEADAQTHPLLDLLTHPNPRQGRTAFVRDLVGYLLLSGNCYLLRAGPTTGAPRELWLLRPDRTQIKAGTPTEPIAAYTYTVNGNRQEFAPEFVRHIRTFNPLDDYYGLPPAKPAARSIDQNNESRKWNVALLQNGARPSGALSADGSLSDEVRTRLREQFEEQRTGPRNAGKHLLLEGGLKWLEMSLSPADMHWLEGQKLSAREIAIVFSVPPELLGDSENKTYSNWQEARQAFYTETILPLLDVIRDELNSWLVPLFGGGIYLTYDADEIEALQENRQQVWSSAAQAYNAGILTKNEAREAMGYQRDTRPESDDFKPNPAPSFSFGSVGEGKGAVPQQIEAKAGIPQRVTASREDRMRHAVKSILDARYHDVIAAIGES